LVVAVCCIAYVALYEYGFEGRRPGPIAAWGEAPGKVQIYKEELKARTIGSLETASTDRTYLSTESWRIFL
jgi:hypothetical protein